MSSYVHITLWVDVFLPCIAKMAWSVLCICLTNQLNPVWTAAAELHGWVGQSWTVAVSDQSSLSLLM